MSIFNSIVDKLVSIVVDEKNIVQEKPNAPVICNECSKKCHSKCACRCHFACCPDCDEKNCDFLQDCPCTCHEEDRKNYNTIIKDALSQRSSAVQKKRNIERRNTIQNFSNRPNLQSKSTNVIPSNPITGKPQDDIYVLPPNAHPEDNLVNWKNNQPNAAAKEDLISPGTFTKRDTFGEKTTPSPIKPNPVMKKEKALGTGERILFEDQSLIANTKLNATPNIPKFTQQQNNEIIIENIPQELVNNEDKTKNSVLSRRRESHMEMLEQDLDPQSINEIERRIKEYMDKQDFAALDKDTDAKIYLHKKKKKENVVHKVLKFSRSKSKPKVRKTPEEEEEEEKKAEKEKKKISLSNIVKAEFVKNKIIDLKTPITNEASDNKFKREQNAITKGMDRLEEHLGEEFYYNNEKLSKKVFNDFENQTSWQSYTTLLITDIKLDDNVTHGKAGVNKNFTSGQKTIK